MAVKKSNIEKKAPAKKAASKKEPAPFFQTEDVKPPTMSARQVTSSQGEPFYLSPVGVGKGAQWHVLDSRRKDAAAVASYPSEALAQEYCNKANAQAKRRWEAKRSPNRRRGD